jgi:agmatinase
MVETRFPVGGMKPIFIGGTHSVSLFPIHAFKRRHEDLHVIHFDAHNDLLYTREVGMSHAAAMLNALVFNQVKGIHSFGLRSYGEQRTAMLRKIQGDPVLAQRVHPYSIGTTKQLLMTPGALAQKLGPLKGLPIYLSVDVDVLSAEELGGKTTSPATNGLNWDELFRAVDIVTRELQVVGGDIVEFNPAPQILISGGYKVDTRMCNLLLVMANGLRRSAQ